MGAEQRSHKAIFHAKPLTHRNNNKKSPVQNKTQLSQVMFKTMLGEKDELYTMFQMWANSTAGDTNLKMFTARTDHRRDQEEMYFPEEQ